MFAPSLSFAPTHVPEETDSAVSVSGFHPNSKGDLEITTLGGAGGSVTFLNIPTNASGGLPTFGTGFKAGACADGVTGAEPHLHGRVRRARVGDRGARLRVEPAFLGLSGPLRPAPTALARQVSAAGERLQ